MKTVVLEIDKNNIEMDKIRYAADVIRDGGLVAFPTETVYGLGANALDQAAVSKIFEAKGRPADNPLIVHIADKAAVGDLAANVPSGAAGVMDKFWPGPITLVMEKSEKVPEIITAGLDTVAIRMPSHPVALELIRLSGVPVAAPSANTSGKPSPTIARHVIEDLSGKVDIIIDAGSADVGLESTVLDLTVKPPMVLRPGGITPSQLSQVLGSVNVDPALLKREMKGVIPKSPGMKYTHYSPNAEVIIIEGKLQSAVDRINQLVHINMEKGRAVGVLATDQTKALYKAGCIISVGDRDKPQTIAANLFRVLREFDELGVQLILAEAVDSTGIGLAVMNRMGKAAGYNIIKAD